MSSATEDIVEAAEAEIRVSPSRWAARMAILAVASALFMQGVDSTALSTALPTLSHAFSTDAVHLKLCLTAYMMALAVFVPASAWLADRFGSRTVFVSAMVVFLIGSVLCALSHNLTELVAARIIQGAGGAMMTPVGRVIVVASHPRDKLFKAMIWLTTPAMLGPIVGPPLSGLILTIAGWPWIFYINIPVGILGIAAVLRFVPHRRQPHPGSFDTVGFILAATGISCAMVGAESIGLNVFPIWAQAGAWVLALALGAAYLRHANIQPQPVLDLRLLKVQTYRANQVGGSLIRMVHGAVPFLLPLLLQSGLGWTPLKAGLVSMTAAIGAVFARLGAHTLLQRFGFRNVLTATAVACGVTVGCIGLFRPDTPLAVIVAVVMLGGLLRADHLTSVSTLSFADLPDRQISKASSFTAVVQQLAQAVGITVSGLMLHISQTLNASRGLRPLAPENLVLPFAAIGMIGLLSAVTYLSLPPDAGANLHGREGVKGRR